MIYGYQLLTVNKYTIIFEKNTHLIINIITDKKIFQ